MDNQENGWKVFDPNLYEPPSDRHSVFGYELLEGNEEGGLQGDRSVDNGTPSRHETSAHDYRTKPPEWKRTHP